MTRVQFIEKGLQITLMTILFQLCGNIYGDVEYIVIYMLSLHLAEIIYLVEVFTCCLVETEVITYKY